MSIDGRSRSKGSVYRILVALCAGIFLVIFFAKAFAGDSRTEIILSDLPPHGSAKYAALEVAAGHPRITKLSRSHSESWSIDASRLPALMQEASAQGVAVTRLGPKANEMLVPYRGPAPMTVDQQGLMQRNLEARGVLGGSAMRLPDDKLLEWALTHPSEPNAPATLFTSLGDNIFVTARRTSIVKTGDGYAWHGLTIDTGEPATFLWWPDGRLTGTISYKGHLYAVKPMGNRMHGVIEMSPALLPPDHEPPRSGSLPHQPPSRPNPRGDRPQAKAMPLLTIVPPAGTEAKLLLSHNPVTVTLIVAYTKQAASYYNDITRDLIDLAVEETNQSFRLSGIDNVEIKLVHSYMTNYTEQGTLFDHLFRFLYDNDGYMDEIHSLRKKYHADLAILLVHDPNGCGLSAQVGASAERAFAVVHHQCAAVSYSLAHEIGHLFGARHDLRLDPSLKPFRFGHGIVDAGNGWRDIMSYEESCGGCPRLPIWSNPQVLIDGTPAGDYLRDNAEVIRERAPIVAKFE